MDVSGDDKYITFKRAEFMEWASPQAMNMATAQARLEEGLTLSLPDAVVIRRQDKFASPALFTYANMIALTASLMEQGHRRQELLDIADYFHRQAEMAGEEAWKLPDR